MSHSEFKARALYKFAAEGPNELSFHANDILTITSNTAGHGWWYAKNASGQVGVIPENYVQALADPPEPNEPPPPLSTFSNNHHSMYPSMDTVNNNANTSRSSYQSNADPPVYMNPVVTNSWQPPEPPPWSPLQRPPTDDQESHSSSYSTSSSSSASPAIERKRTYSSSLVLRLSDGYATVVEIVPTARFHPAHALDSESTDTSFVDPEEGWYASIPQTPTPIMPPAHQRFPFNFTPKLVVPTRKAPPIPIFRGASSSTSDSVDESSNTTQSLPVLTRKLCLSPSLPILKSTELNPVTGPVSTKTKRKIFTFNRFKRKKATKLAAEPSHQSTRRDTDSDESFSDSEYPSPSNQAMNSNTTSRQHAGKSTNTVNLNNSTVPIHGRPSVAGNEAIKAPTQPKARFFDKHGLDSYLLNGSKTKSDEHVEITFDDREGGVFWSPNPGIPPFSCRVEDPSKGTKLGGLKAFMEYKIHPQIPGSRVVGRRYKQFDWLHEQLVNKFRFICIPPLPGKQIAGRFEQDFIEERRRLLELWLNRVCRHPVLCASFSVQHFIACELTEKNKKDWKNGKRKIEKDDLREASWLQCVTLIRTGITDQQIQAQIDAFASQQPGLESQLKNLSQGITKYLERHIEVYERDIQRVSELFSRVHLAVQVDTTTPGNKDLSSSIMKISGSYSGIADLYKTKASEGLRDFNERLQEYIGLLGCFPSIISIQKSASDFMRTVQQRAPSTTTDFSSAIHRNHVLNHVVLAEINFFQQEKVTDLNVYMKTLVDEQIQFYEKVTGELRDASFTFK